MFVSQKGWTVLIAQIQKSLRLFANRRMTHCESDQQMRHEKSNARNGGDFIVENQIVASDLDPEAIVQSSAVSNNRASGMRFPVSRHTFNRNDCRLELARIFSL